MATKEYSSVQEHKVADALGWEVVTGSGARPTVPGDVKSDKWLGECKTHTEKGQKIFFDLAVWQKISKEAVGFSVNSKNPDDVAAAVEQILKWRGNVSKFDVDDYKADLASGETWLAHGYSTDVAQLMAGDPENGVPAHGDIGFALPREGFVIAFDEMVVPSGSRRKDLAHAFINYVYNAEVAADNMRFIHGPMPVAPAMDLLDDQYRAFIILDDAMLRNGQVLRSFDEYPEAQELYNRAWDRIKAADAE